MEGKSITEQESLQIITEMIQKVKKGFHESGTSAILWGSVVAFCGITGFLEGYFHFSIGFDIWILTLVALIPQVFISIREKRKRNVLTHEESVLNVVWGVYAISIFAVIFYVNIIPYTSAHLLSQDGFEFLRKNTVTGEISTIRPYALSSASLLLIIFAIPTLITGWSLKFTPMTIGAVICYLLFVLSLFTSQVTDSLLMGVAGIFNWLLPGIILWNRYQKSRRTGNV